MLPQHGGRLHAACDLDQPRRLVVDANFRDAGHAGKYAAESGGGGRDRNPARSAVAGSWTLGHRPPRVVLPRLDAKRLRRKRLGRERHVYHVERLRLAATASCSQCVGDPGCGLQAFAFPPVARAKPLIALAAAGGSPSAHANSLDAVTAADRARSRGSRFGRSISQAPSFSSCCCNCSKCSSYTRAALCRAATLKGGGRPSRLADHRTGQHHSRVRQRHVADRNVPAGHQQVVDVFEYRLRYGIEYSSPMQGSRPPGRS